MAQESPPLPAAPTVAGPTSGLNNPLVKTGLTIVEALLLSIIGFAFSHYYIQLSKSTEVRWKAESVKCVDSSCHEGNLLIKVYKLGGEPEAEAKFLFAVLDPSTYQLVKTSVLKYDVSLMNNVLSPSKDEVKGVFATYPNDDPELNPKTAFNFTVDKLETGQVYEVNIQLHSKPAQFTSPGRFEVQNAQYLLIGYKGMGVRHYLILYFIEGMVFGIVLLVLIGFLAIGVTWGGRRFLAALKRPLHLLHSLGGQQA